jgi:hypothetical protein
MTDDKFHQNWAQVRIFSKRPPPGQYADLLVRAVKPFVDGNLGLRFFFSYYFCRLGSDDGETNIKAIPPEFLFYDTQKTPHHGSIKLRFRARKDEKSNLEQRLGLMLHPKGDFWFSEILLCTPEAVLPTDRFATDQQPIPRASRTRLVAELLQANCRLVLDNLQLDAGVWRFQDNDHDLNKPLKSVVKSVEHMILNVWRRNDANAFPIYGFEPGTIYPL